HGAADAEGRAASVALRRSALIDPLEAQTDADRRQTCPPAAVKAAFMEAQMHLLPPMVELDLILLILTLAMLAIAWLTCIVPGDRVDADHRGRRRHHSNH